MARKLMIILLLLGFCASVVAWVAQARAQVLIYSSTVPENVRQICPLFPEFPAERLAGTQQFGNSDQIRPPLGAFSFATGSGYPPEQTEAVTHTIGCAYLAEGALIARIGKETIITDCSYISYLKYERIYPANLTWRIPIWSIALVCAVVSGLLTVPPVLRRRKRARRGQCLRCAYDLRGSKERCPECGTEFGADRPTLKAES